jgi:hypothetical protein
MKHVACVAHQVFTASSLERDPEAPGFGSVNIVTTAEGSLLIIQHIELL